MFLQLAESWWWESNRMVPINVFLKAEWAMFRPTLKTLNSKDSKYIHYTNQVVHDSIMQYDGKVNKQISKEFKFTKIRYVGSLIRTSRGQCCKWVNMKYINIKDLPNEIRWASNTNNYYGRFKCGGMIDDTTKENFIELRGGYNCRHRAFGVK